MKKTFKLILVSVFFFTSSVILAQEINLTGGKIKLTGGNFFKGVEVKNTQNSCSVLFKYKSKGKVAVPVESRKFFIPAYDSVSIVNPLAQNDSSIVIDDEVFYRHFAISPGSDTNVIPETEEGEQSIIQDVVFIPEQEKLLTDKYEFIEDRKNGDRIVPKDTLTLSGFFYIIDDKPSKNPVDILTTETYTSEKWGDFTQTIPSGKQEILSFSELCTKYSIPFIKLDNGKLLVPVAADGKALSSLNWILSKYFDIN